MLKTGLFQGKHVEDQVASASPINDLRDLRELLASQALAAAPPQPIGAMTLDDLTFNILDFSFGAGTFSFATIEIVAQAQDSGVTSSGLFDNAP
jgi:hypothetical protein